MVALVKDTIADEELRHEPPQKLLVINRCTLGVFLSFKIPLHLMKPGLFCYLFGLKIAAMCRFVQFLDNNPGSLVVPFDFEHRRHRSSVSAN